MVFDTVAINRLQRVVERFNSVVMNVSGSYSEIEWWFDDESMDFELEALQLSFVFEDKSVWAKIATIQQPEIKVSMPAAAERSDALTPDQLARTLKAQVATEGEATPAQAASDPTLTRPLINLDVKTIRVQADDVIGQSKGLDAIRRFTDDLGEGSEH